MAGNDLDIVLQLVEQLAPMMAEVRRNLIASLAKAQSTQASKTYDVMIAARNDPDAERWRDWMRSDGTQIIVDDFIDGRNDLKDER